MGLLPSFVFAAVAVATAGLYYSLLLFLDSVSEVHEYTAAQLGVAVGYGILLSIYAGAEAGFWVHHLQPKYSSVSEDEEEASAMQLVQEDGSSASSPAPKPAGNIFFVKQELLPALRSAAEFVAIMGYIYVCDRTTLIAKGDKVQTKVGFWCVNALILLAGIFSLRQHKSADDVKPLQRDQTEEWKGWMQIMFVLYHYFAEAEIYNAIRLYIAAYVWMTGFGNFSYYYIKADFTILRFAQMMWRLNFFVFFVCVTMNNEYMLYYICPMHTFFTWLVYIALYAGHQFNKNDVLMVVKLLATVAVAVLLYDVPGTFHVVMSPFKFLLDFHDPLHPEFKDALHEWFFRSGLDHLVWVFGMFCAFHFPWFDRKFAGLEQLPAGQKFGAKLALAGATSAVFVWWLVTYFSLGKRDYNKVHPYTSFIPIYCYMILRNLTPTLRRWHMHLFAWTGKITLETYILQFHIWMKTTGLNGSPKHLMVVLPGFYWTNFVLISAVYIFMSYRVFNITNDLKNACIPHDTIGIFKAMAGAGAGLAVLYGAGAMLKGA